MKPGINVQEAINFFVGPGNERSNIRLPIVDEEGKIANIVSPTMILKFLAEHLAELPEQHVSRRIGAIPGLVTPQVRTVKSTERAIDAFALMHLNQFSALGIEDVEGPLHRHIVSAISFKVKRRDGNKQFLNVFFFLFIGCQPCTQGLLSSLEAS